MSVNLGAVRDLIEAGLSEPADAGYPYGVSAVRDVCERRCHHRWCYGCGSDERRWGVRTLSEDGESLGRTAAARRVAAGRPSR